MSKENKFKVINKNGISQIIIKSAKDQNVSDREVYAINNGMISGFLPVDVDRKSKSFTLTFDTTGLITLNDYLLTPLNRHTFSMILNSVLAVFEGMKKQYFGEKALILDTSMVFVNPAKQQFLFLYVPIQYYESGRYLREFLLDLIQVGSFQQGEDNSYVQEYIKIVNAGINFSIFQLEEYAKTLSSANGFATQKEVICDNCKSRIEAKYLYCPICGAKVLKTDSGQNNGPSKTYIPGIADGIGNAMNKSFHQSNEVMTGSAIHTFHNSTPVISNNAEPGTTLLGEDAIKAAFLVRTKSNERIYLNKDYFVLGKSSSCDYAIKDNGTISRQHTAIIRNGDEFSIKDLGSTNKTYVNGNQIVEAMISTGDKIRMSNEEFVFHYE